MIPTGIGAEIGGYAGDALPVARGIASVCDRLITHPNVMNGAQLYWPIANAFYVEGYGFDQYAAGNWGLKPVRSNRIALVLDQGIETDLRLRHLQVADAARATLGLQLTDAVVTDAPLNVTLKTAPSGATWGTLENPDSLLRAVEKSIHNLGATAIAVVARFPDNLETEALQNYRQGQGVDPLAGAEAVISHLIVRTFQVPCAHAPALQPLPVDPQVSPRSAAEELGYTFLPSVLVGLSRAPQFVQERGSSVQLWVEELDAIVIPETACGGSAVLSLSQTSTRIIAVENPTALQVTPEGLGIEVTKVRSYLEAMGVLAAQRAGVESLALTSQLSNTICHISNPIRLDPMH